MSKLRKFSKDDLKKIRRGQHKYQDEILKLCDSLLSRTKVDEAVWMAYSKYRCKWCKGLGLVEISHPKFRTQKVPCQCSVRNRVKDECPPKKTPVWTVIRNGVEEPVYARKLDGSIA